MPFDELKDWPLEENESLDSKREFNRMRSQFIKEARKRSKLTKCVLCGKETTKFCNSHTIPQFILRNIANKGHFHYWRDFWNVPFIEDEIGMKRANVFHVICEECDSKVFSKYENPDSYSNIIDNEMMREIALKNYLREYDRKLFEKQLFSLLEAFLREKETNNLSAELFRIGMINYTEEKQKTARRDIVDYRKCINIAKGPKPFQYELVYRKQLTYVVPIAVQAEINLIRGLRGELINNIFNFDRSYELFPIHICIFPFQNHSEIVMFIQKNHKSRYKRFIKDFLTKNTEEQLHLISYIIPLYIDSFLLSDNLSESVKKSEKLREIVHRLQDFSDIIPKNERIEDRIEQETRRDFSLNEFREVPNYLSEKYALKKSLD